MHEISLFTLYRSAMHIYRLALHFVRELSNPSNNTTMFELNSYIAASI